MNQWLTAYRVTWLVGCSLCVVGLASAHGGTGLELEAVLQLARLTAHNTEETLRWGVLLNVAFQAILHHSNLRGGYCSVLLLVEATLGTRRCLSAI